MINEKGQEPSSFIPLIKSSMRTVPSPVPRGKAAKPQRSILKMMISTITKTERVNIQGRGAVETDKDRKAQSARYSPWATKGH